VWAALCTGRADGSNPKYPARAKHAILAMVRAPESEAESTIYALLQSNGWREPEIKNLKLLNEPFHSDDPIMRACHESAIKKDGLIVVIGKHLVTDNEPVTPGKSANRTFGLGEKHMSGFPLTRPLARMTGVGDSMIRVGLIGGGNCLAARRAVDVGCGSSSFLFAAA